MVAPRRRRAWADTTINETLATNGLATFDLLTGLTAAETKTSVRILAHINFQIPITTGGDLSQLCYVTIGVVSKEAFDLTTLPDPDNMADYPQQGWVYANMKVCSSVDTWRQPAIFDIDLRGQRKVDRGILYLEVLNKNQNGNGSVDVDGRVRVLCLT